MSDDSPTPEEPAAETPPAPAKTAAKPAAPPRELPSPEQIAAWISGADLPTLSALFDKLPVMRFDALVMQIRKEELLPQHWQAISSRTIRDDKVFEAYPEVRRLRAGGGETASGRIAALESAWRELGGKQPSLWTVADLFAALRRIIDRKLEVDFHDLLSATRDVWAGSALPRGREQLDSLWACLDLVRNKTK